jgi:hypothetical protein
LLIESETSTLKRTRRERKKKKVIASGAMEIYLFLLVIASLSLKTPSNAIQFEDSAENLGQTK